MKTLLFFVLVLSLAGCYNTFTREDLVDLKNEAIVIWMQDGSHYHLQQWTIDDRGNVNGVGTKCSSKSTKFDHPHENATDFSGTVQKSSIVTVKTSSTHSSSAVAIWVVLIAVALAIAIASSFSLHM